MYILVEGTTNYIYNFRLKSWYEKFFKMKQHKRVSDDEVRGIILRRTVRKRAL